MTNPNVIYVKPNAGARIRQPERGGRVMPAVGDWVSANDVYYAARIADGGVTVCEPPQEKPAAEPTTEAAKGEAKVK